jgi:NAD(P)-dependent dehydrogenase (short-subunit alcohol dehydrogenase family)
MRMSEFNRRSTAEEVSEGIDLAGKHAIVTGANTGIGLETTRVLALRGCRVTMACRDLDRAAGGRDLIVGESSERLPAAGIDIMHLDLGSLASVRSFAQAYLETERPIHLLVNNAGVMLPDRRETSDGFEAHFGVNHLGHFLLTNLLLPRLRTSAPARVVTVASDAKHKAAHTAELDDLDWRTRRYSGWRSYGSSKLMNLLFSNELNRRESDAGVVATALHPGMVLTELGRDQGWLMKLVGILAWPVMKRVGPGAATTVYLATRPEFADRGGLYFADCAPARVPKLSEDRDVQARLWSSSEELVGLRGS